MGQRFLDQSIPVQESDIPLLDQLAAKAWRENNQEALNIFTHFVERDDAFPIVAPILSSDKTNIYLKMVALMIFKKFILERWEKCTDEERVNFRSFLTGFIMNQVQRPEYSAVVNSADQVFLEIVKSDWPAAYPTMIQDLLQSASLGEQAYSNCLTLLVMLAQEMVRFTDPNMKSARLAEMQEAFQAEAEPVMRFIYMSFANPNGEIVHKALKCLRAFVKACDPSDLGVDMNLLSEICSKLLPDKRFTVDCLSLLAEVASSGAPQWRYNEQEAGFWGVFLDSFTAIFHQVVEVLGNLFGPDICESDVDNETIFQFVDSMGQLVEQYRWFEQIQRCPDFPQTLTWMMQITMNASNLDELKSCVAVWLSVIHHSTRIMGCGNTEGQGQIENPYLPFWKCLVTVLIAKMEIPQMSMARVDEYGFACRGSVSNYGHPIDDKMTNLLNSIAHLCLEDTVEMFRARLEEIRASNPFDREGIERFCWACSAMWVPNPVMEGNEDSQFLVPIITTLSELSRSLQDPNDRVAVSKGFIHLCAYGVNGVLSTSHELLKTVMVKMIEFSGSRSWEVQDAAVDAISQMLNPYWESIANRVSRETPSILEEMISNLRDILAPLSPTNTVKMYDTFSKAVTRMTNNQIRDRLGQILLESVVTQLGGLANSQQFSNPDYDKQLIFVLKCMMKLVKRLHAAEVSQTADIVVPQLNQIYTGTIAHFSQLVASGAAETDEAVVIKQVKGAVVACVSNYASQLVPMSPLRDPLLSTSFDLYLQEYATNEAGRVSQVLKLFTIIISRFPDVINKHLVLIFTSLFKTTGTMLSAGLDDVEFFKRMNDLTAAFVSNGITILTSISQEDVCFFVECMKWNCRYPHPTVAEKAVHNLQNLLTTITNLLPARFTDDFYDFFLLPLLDLALELLTDSVHKFMLENVIWLLKGIITILATRDKVKEIVELFCTRFPKRSPEEHYQVIDAMLKESTRYCRFDRIVKSFLVSIRKFSAKDPALAAEEKQKVNQMIDEQKAAAEDGTTQEDEAQRQARDLADFINKSAF